ncbi:MAG: acetate kinase [Chloroflexi bacterium]|nr:acetate kinase [Chloroflexota bacterium]OJV88698.1 MAG: acetate kinase [Chloroflexi bacterium 54-19]
MTITKDAGKLLVLNAGSSSLKMGLFELPSLSQTLEEGITWGTGGDESGISDHQGALQHLLAKIVIKDVAAVGHRVVHGGNRFNGPALIDETVKAEIRDVARLAPLHNGAALKVIEATEKLLPGVTQVAAFDTAFHSTLAPAAYLYPVPRHWYEEWGVRRYGFHGLSYTYCSEQAAAMLGKPLDELKLVTCHLGSGCSLAAIDRGRSVATTMGLTPLEGLMMGTRSGSIDPGAVLYLLNQGLLSVSELDRALNYESGLKAIGGSNDFRQIVAGRASGDELAALAFEMFTNRVSQGIAAMAVALGRVDGLIFAGGIGEHSPELRAEVARQLAILGIVVDATKNLNLQQEGPIHSETSKTPVLIIHTREDVVVARQTLALLNNRAA